MTQFAGEVHPFADRFPMLDDESLKALAEDIAANGLLHPIVLDGDGVLIDGRNRLRACEIAGAEPEFTVFDGDPVAFIIGQNMQRRDLTQAQKAHVATCLDSKQRDAAAIAGVSPGMIGQAAIVRRYSPESSDAVIAGAMPHSKAYEAAKAQKDELAEQARRMQILTLEAPDILATGLPLDEAWAAYERRTQEQRRRDEMEAARHKQFNSDLVGGLLTIDSLSHPALLAEAVEHYRPISRNWTADDIRGLIPILQELADSWKDKA